MREATPRGAYAGVVPSELVFKMAGTLPYEQALSLQRELHALRVNDEIPDTCLLLEHLPVYTAGRRTEVAAVERATTLWRSTGQPFLL